jgi:hypothetical protein
MVLSKGFEPPDLLVATLSGVVTPKDQSELAGWVRDTIGIVGSVRVLVKLKQFAGWRLDTSFDDATLWLQDTEAVSRLAVVGEQKWRLAVLTTIAQPLRRIPIEYFDSETAARGWLGSEKATSTISP